MARGPGRGRGLTTQEAAGWLGRSRASMDRRWDLAFRVLLAGLAPGSPARGS